MTQFEFSARKMCVERESGAGSPCFFALHLEKINKRVAVQRWRARALEGGNDGRTILSEGDLPVVGPQDLGAINKSAIRTTATEQLRCSPVSILWVEVVSVVIDQKDGVVPSTCIYIV